MALREDYESDAAFGSIWRSSVSGIERPTAGVGSASTRTLAFESRRFRRSRGCEYPTSVSLRAYATPHLQPRTGCPRALKDRSEK